MRCAIVDQIARVQDSGQTSSMLIRPNRRCEHQNAGYADREFMFFRLWNETCITRQRPCVVSCSASRNSGAFDERSKVIAVIARFLLNPNTGRYDHVTQLQLLTNGS